MDWRTDALCAQVDTDTFYPEPDGDNGHAAKEVCRVCPTRLACLIHAIETNEPYGIWGGFSERARKKITVAGAQDAINADNDRHDAKAELRALRPVVHHRGRTTGLPDHLIDAHSRYSGGDRHPATVEGEREYQRLYRRRSRGAKRAAA